MVQQVVAGTAAGVAADKVINTTPGIVAKEPSIINIHLVTADKEYEYRVPTGCKKFMLQMRDGTAFKVTTVPNGTKTINANYFTIRTNGAIWWDDLNIIDSQEAVLYLACASANKVIEIWQWS